MHVITHSFFVRNEHADPKNNNFRLEKNFGVGFPRIRIIIFYTHAKKISKIKKNGPKHNVL